jgi:hypothetical protein
MAWRIEESVIRGEIDNRVRGRMTGRIWFTGCTEPVELNLAGDCWRDLAGRRLEFTNPEPKPGVPASFAARQEGTVGDITASRKVKVPDIPLDQIGEYYAARKPFPWHWGNSFYLEWFSTTNGRVVIESASYELKIIGDPAWEMTPEEEETQRRANGKAMGGFMERLGEAMPEENETKFAQSGDGEGPAEWDEKPQTEEEAEQMQARSDRLADRIQARLAREGEGADYERILHEEIERMRRERGEPDPTSEQLARNAEWIEEMNRAGEEAVNDPQLREEIERRHPLAEQAQELTLRLMREPKERGWLPESAGEEHPVVELVAGVMKAGAKLAGALNGRDWPPDVERCAGVIVRLKRTRGYLDDAMRAAESCQEQKLTETAWLAAVLVEIVDLANETDLITADLRARLERRID